MDDNYTHLTLVVDRSGSMITIREDAEGGVNALIAAQAVLPGAITLTLVEFDHSIDTALDHVLLNAADLPKYHLQPRGSTALFDAIGHAITQTGTWLAGLDEADRPGKVIFAVMTDGEENSSIEWTSHAISALIKQQTETYNWEFVFMAAGLPTRVHAIASDLGFDANKTTVLPRRMSGLSAQATFASASRSIANYRETGVTRYATAILDDGTEVE